MSLHLRASPFIQANCCQPQQDWLRIPQQQDFTINTNKSLSVKMYMIMVGNIILKKQKKTLEIFFWKIKQF